MKLKRLFYFLFVKRWAYDRNQLPGSGQEARSLYEWQKMPEDFKWFRGRFG